MKRDNNNPSPGEQAKKAERTKPFFNLLTICLLAIAMLTLGFVLIRENVDTNFLGDLF